MCLLLIIRRLSAVVLSYCRVVVTSNDLANLRTKIELGIVVRSVLYNNSSADNDQQYRSCRVEESWEGGALHCDLYGTSTRYLTVLV